MAIPRRAGFAFLVLVAWAAALSVPALPQAAAHKTPLAGSPPMGWNSWDCYGTSVTEGDLGGRAGEEQLIGQVEHLAWNGGLAHFQALQACEFHDGIPGQTTENRMCQVGREQHAVLDEEDVLAGTLAHGAIGRKSNALGESEALGLLADELAREVIAAGFGERRQGVGSNPLPGGDADVDAGFLALMAQVFAPFPGCNRHIHRRIDLRRHANLAVAAKGHRADVSPVRERVDGDDLATGVVDLILGKRDVYAVDLG